MTVLTSNLISTNSVAFSFTTTNQDLTIIPGVTVASAESTAINSTFASCDVTVGGTVAAGSIGISMAASANVVISSTGQVLSEASSISGAVYLQGGGAHVQNSGQIVASHGTGIVLFSGGNTVDNHGTISGGSNGVFLGLFGGVGDVLNNYGFITSIGTSGTDPRYNHALQIEGNNARVENWGDISSYAVGAAAISIGNSDLIKDTGDGTVILNHGTVTSNGGWGIDFSAMKGTQTATIFNDGTISGALGGIRGNDMNNLVTNHGHIVGDVDLGIGNDTFDGTHGAVDGNILGGDGSDIYIVSDASAQLVELANQGIDVVQSLVFWTLGDNFENLTLLGGDAISGYGNTVANQVFGNKADNVLNGFGGNDTINGNAGDDRVDGDAGNDQLLGGFGDDTVLGRIGNDNLSGQQGEDVMLGGLGADTLNGGDGDDTLIGGAGADVLTGGADADVFRFRALSDSTQATHDTITDFAKGTDVIDLSQIDANATLGGNQAFTYLGAAAFTNHAGQLHLTGTGANRFLDGDVNGDGVADFHLQLNGVTSLSGSDLIL